jgi:hypothetical protein
MLPVRGNRRAFGGGQRSALRLKNRQKISVQAEVIGPVAGEALCAHGAALAFYRGDPIRCVARSIT